MGNYINRVHEEILSVMDQVVRVCDKNNIQYYLIGGTLLGAVRHKGFIPWDDDLDIVMPREDFNKFVAICDQEMTSNYKLLWSTTDKDYWYPFAKVHNTNTVFVESTYANSSHISGIYVDIFPLDDTEGYNEKVEKNKKIISRLNAVMRRKVLPGDWFNKYKLLSFLFSNRRWNSIQERLMCKENGRGFKYYANYGSYYSIKKQVMLKSWYGEGTCLEFEGRRYRAPSQYEDVLRSIYGSTYMEVPPEDKRITHYPSRVVFPDGTEMLFDVDESKRVEKE